MPWSWSLHRNRAIRQIGMSQNHWGGKGLVPRVSVILNTDHHTEPDTCPCRSREPVFRVVNAPQQKSITYL